MLPKLIAPIVVTAMCIVSLISPLYPGSCLGIFRAPPQRAPPYGDDRINKEGAFLKSLCVSCPLL